MEDILNSDFLSRSFRSAGYGSGGTIDCNAALGLIGLLGLIELLRDMIQEMTMEEEEATTRRKRRSIGSVPLDFLPPFLSDKSSGFSQVLPSVIVPLLHNMADVNDGFEDPVCMERSICEANRHLVEESASNGVIDGTARSIVASLISQVVANSFTGFDSSLHQRALDAAEAGRQGVDCGATYYQCPLLKPEHRPFTNANLTKSILWM